MTLCNLLTCFVLSQQSPGSYCLCYCSTHSTLVNDTALQLDCTTAILNQMDLVLEHADRSYACRAAR